MTTKQKQVTWISAGLLIIGLVAAFFAYCPIAQDGSAEQSQFFGYEPHPEETAEFVKSLPTPTLSDADPNLFKADKVDTFLYRALYKAYRKTYGTEWRPHKQGIGDCVSHAWGLSADIANAVDYETGKIGEFKVAATEPIYGGSRVEARGVSFGGWSDGSYGGAAAKWVVKDKGIGGLLFRQKYEDFDFTIYSSSLAKNFGAYGCGGKDDNGKLDKIAREHPVVQVTLVRNFEEAAAAIQSGYPVAVCSGQGFSSTRDSEGFARPSGSWAHAMTFCAVRYGDRPGLCCCNSWGVWNGGPKWPEDQPDGSFWVDADVATRMLRGGDSFAVSGTDGFKFRDLDHSAWVQVKPKENHKSDEILYAIAN